MSRSANEADTRLRKLLGDEALAPLRRRLRRYFEHMEPTMLPGTLQLNNLTPLEREALAVLAGRPPRQAASMRIDIADLDTVLRNAGIAASLRDALEQLDGPILHLASLRAEAQARWSAVVANCRHSTLAQYLQGPAALGLLKRLTRQDPDAAGRLLERVRAVLQRLPAPGLPRAQLAAETLGNAHALDDGHAVATLVLAVWRRREDDAPDAEDDERARAIWARAGVLVNELARPALFLNLPVQQPGGASWTPGEPGYLSLRRLLRAAPAWAVAGRTVFVCENPNLVAIAADRLGASCAPLICTDGMPAAAQRSLLSQLAESGASLRYHGDFDWPGIQIANRMIGDWGAQPWRLGIEDYEVAVAGAPHAQKDLIGTGVAALWDPDLAPAMRRHGLAIAEEAISVGLLEDLAFRPGCPD